MMNWKSLALRFIRSRSVKILLFMWRELWLRLFCRTSCLDLLPGNPICSGLGILFLQYKHIPKLLAAFNMQKITVELGRALSESIFHLFKKGLVFTIVRVRLPSASRSWWWLAFSSTSLSSLWAGGTRKRPTGVVRKAFRLNLSFGTTPPPVIKFWESFSFIWSLTTSDYRYFLRFPACYIFFVFFCHVKKIPCFYITCFVFLAYNGQSQNTNVWSLNVSIFDLILFPNKNKID